MKGEMWGWSWIGNYEQMQAVWKLSQIGNYELMTYEFWFMKKHAWLTCSHRISWSRCLLGNNWVLASWCLAVGIDSNVPHTSLASFNFLDILQLGSIPTCVILVIHFQKILLKVPSSTERNCLPKNLAQLKENARQKSSLPVRKCSPKKSSSTERKC